jgi:RNA exonuclease 4
MVGLGPLGSESSLARVSIVNFHGHIILDTFVLQRERVTDWRTWVSGVAPKDMENALPFEEVQKNVAKLVGGKVLIGHAVHNDTQVCVCGGGGGGSGCFLRATDEGTTNAQSA